MWSSGDHSWEMIRNMKQDFPLRTAQYIADFYVSNKIGRNPDRLISWSNKVIRDYSRAVRRVNRLYEFHFGEDDTIL